MTYLGTEPWKAPVTIRGTVSDSGGPLEDASVSCNEASMQTNSVGYYSLTVEPVGNPLFKSEYEVTVTYEDYSTDKYPKLRPDGNITVDFLVSP